MNIRKIISCGKCFALALLATPLFAGVTNPDISLIGQVRSDWTNNPASLDSKRPTLYLGETELSADAALNPYATGAVVLSFADESVSVEEAYMKLEQGLPWGLAMKAGKYRAPFGKLNPAHPHAYPFLDAPHVMDPANGLIPGQESYNETALELSELFPGIDTWAPLLSFDVQQGSSFRNSQDTNAAFANFDSLKARTDMSWLAHLANSFMVGDGLAGDLGFSLARGTTNVEKQQHALLVGTDLKLKFYVNGETHVVWQTEGIWRRDDSASAQKLGGYSFVDWQHNRFNAGALYEQLGDAKTGKVSDRSVKGFAGFSLMEETTLFRIAAEHRWLAGVTPYNTIEAQVLFSMGPHKPHQF